MQPVEGRTDHVRKAGVNNNDAHFTGPDPIASDLDGCSNPQHLIDVRVVVRQKHDELHRNDAVIVRRHFTRPCK